MFGIDPTSDVYQFYNVSIGAYSVQKCSKFAHSFSVPMRNIYAPLFKQIEEENSCSGVCN